MSLVFRIPEMIRKKLSKSIDYFELDSVFKGFIIQLLIKHKEYHP